MARVVSAAVPVPCCGLVPLPPLCGLASESMSPRDVFLTGCLTLRLAEAVPEQLDAAKSCSAMPGHPCPGAAGETDGYHVANCGNVAWQNCEGSQTRRRSACTIAAAESLRSHLAELNGVPTDRIFIVRKVQQFGLDSARVVQAHFSAYGSVENVLVAHSYILSGCRRYIRRTRPANMAIVVMARSAMAEIVHSEGVEQRVQGKLVVVERYERRGEATDMKAPEMDVAKCGIASFDVVQWGEESTADGCSSGASDHVSEDDSDGACISGDFEYWATDDEGYW